MDLAAWARQVAEPLLAPLPRRWAHTKGVARQAETLDLILGDEANVLVAAAYLHDIGYSPDLVDTGLHPLDGARYLRSALAADERVVRLVAHHSCALLEAEERGLKDQLAEEFVPERAELVDAMLYCDMTTGPDGEQLAAEDRLAEIVSRYRPTCVVGRFIRRATPEILSAVRRVEQRLAAVESR